MHAQFSAEGGESAASGAAIGLGIDLGVGRAGKEAGSGVAPGLLCQPFGGQGGVLRGAGNCRVHRLGQGDGVGGCGDEQKPGEYDMPGGIVRGVLLKPSHPASRLWAWRGTA